MTGLLTILDMLGNTIEQLQVDLAQARAEISRLQAALADANTTLDAFRPTKEPADGRP